MDGQTIRDFTVSDEFSDVTLIVEDTNLYVHKQYLAEWSTVWRRLFLSESGETTTELPLPDKKLEKITELLHCIYSTQKPISENNVRYLLDLAEEYEMDSMKLRCEDFLISQDKSLEILVLAEKFNLKTLFKRSIEYARTRTLEELERSPEYKILSPDTIIKIYKEKIDMMRDYANDLKQQEKKVTHQRDQLECEKEGMIGVFQSIQKLWDMPNKRCYRHMTDEKYDYTCRDCNEKIQREAKKMCHDGQHVRRFYINNNKGPKT